MRLLLVDDHPLVRDGIAQMLATVWPQADIRCADNAETGLALARMGADLILLDLGLPGMAGAEALTTLRHQYPDIPVIVITASDNRNDLEACVRAGARAFVGKNATPQALVEVINRVMAGDTVFPSASSRAAPAHDVSNLTTRQCEILQLVCAGHPTKEIALRLFVGESTVKTHITAIFKALGVANRTQAVLAARRYGLVTNAT